MAKKAPEQKDYTELTFAEHALLGAALHLVLKVARNRYCFKKSSKDAAFFKKLEHHTDTLRTMLDDMFMEQSCALPHGASLYYGVRADGVCGTDVAEALSTLMRYCDRTDVAGGDTTRG